MQACMQASMHAFIDSAHILPLMYTPALNACVCFSSLLCACSCAIHMTDCRAAALGLESSSGANRIRLLHVYCTAALLASSHEHRCLYNCITTLANPRLRRNAQHNASTEEMASHTSVCKQEDIHHSAASEQAHNKTSKLTAKHTTNHKMLPHLRHLLLLLSTMEKIRYTVAT